MTDLSEMRRIAEAAAARGDFNTAALQTAEGWAHVEAFDPPNVLALLDVVEAAVDVAHSTKHTYTLDILRDAVDRLESL